MEVCLGKGLESAVFRDWRLEQFLRADGRLFHIYIYIYIYIYILNAEKKKT